MTLCVMSIWMNSRIDYCTGDEWSCNWLGERGINISDLKMFDLPYFLDTQIKGQVANIRGLSKKCQAIANITSMVCATSM